MNKKEKELSNFKSIRPINVVKVKKQRKRKSINQNSVNKTNSHNFFAFNINLFNIIKTSITIYSENKETQKLIVKGFFFYLFFITGIIAFIIGIYLFR